jgi:hypothetical protein
MIRRSTVPEHAAAAIGVAIGVGEDFDRTPVGAKGDRAARPHRSG